MYLVLVWGAIVHPRRTMRRIACSHESTTESRMLDAGMGKMWWCTSCDATWFHSGSAA